MLSYKINNTESIDFIKPLRQRYALYDYKGYSASAARHSIHNYPAMLHYLMVKDLITKYTNRNSLVYDPFCGSGVSIVEALYQGRKVYGTDINPLGLLIADVRSSDYDEKDLMKTFKRMEKAFPKINPDIPLIKNIDFWFKDYIIKDLGKIRNFITSIDDIKIKEFFLCVFSDTVRKVSNNRNNEFKRFRLRDITEHNPNVLETFENIFGKYLKAVISNPINNSNYKLFLHDVRKPLPFNKKVDFVITSPPYGDSKTTVAYGQFSSFSLEWIKGLNPFGDADLTLDRLCLGGDKIKEECELPSKVLYETLKKIENPDRAKDVYRFFYDLFLSCRQIFDKLNKQAKVCFVVGNRKVSGIDIPMDIVTADFFESLGLSLREILVREISNKRMPSINSPTNVSGVTSSTMKNEFIVILEK
jgi:DNA modification methylase